VRAGVAAALARAGIAPSEIVAPIVHATTLVTNALIERKGARTALVATAGHEDALEIGRETRYDSYDLALEKPEDALVLALVGIPEDPRQMTANLAGPLVVNTQTKQGRQVILNTESYSLKFPIISDRSDQ
jgi:N-methylhydantoinase A/oxoprolinase/acetone carboxylase beta subunit